MSIDLVRSSARARFGEVFTYLTFISSLEPQDFTPPSLEIKIMRGLFYVHLYAAIEKTLNELVEDTLLTIKNKNIRNKDLKIHVNVISLHPKLLSFKDCSSKNFLERAKSLFLGTESDDIFPINETMMGMYMQNIHYSTLQNLSVLFELPNFVPSPLDQIIIDEIVSKRNAVAHGREQASEIGQSFNCQQLRTKMMSVQGIIFSYIDILDSYLESKSYIKESSKNIYN
jgi:hypothetical protein